MSWPEIERLYLEACALPRAERAAYLDHACANDSPLRREVDSLLEADGAHADFLENPPSHLAAGLLERLDEPVTSIGNYRVIRLLGEGGMGMVYEAQQQTPRRTVALKVIKPGMAGEQILRRFQQETETLGRLQHPGIAQIYDAGTAEQGSGFQPFFAMELIQGRPLLRYAEEAKLDVRAKLELMAKVCDAVNHAHQRGILHRDLKPANILVDQTGQPKILDFGVARVTDSDLQATRQTDLGQIIGTLAYMSPEQATGNAQELDIRSDVYSLGVTLYELLAGRLPYPVKGLPLPEALRTIEEQDATALSRLDARYRGDVEVIVEKALEKSKERRYGTTAELASDIRRFIADEPITARPASTLYQVKKFTRRHRALVLGAVAVLASLMAGVIVSSYEAVRARAAERQANSAAASARAVTDFLQNDLLAQANTDNQSGPGVHADRNLSVRAALDRAANRITGKFAKQPDVEAEIRSTIANTYSDLGSYKEARQHIERALELRRSVFGPDDSRTLQTQTQLAGNLLTLGMLTDAESLIQRTIASQRRLLGSEHPDLLASQTVLAHTYYQQGRYREAAELTERVLAIQRRILGSQHAATLRTQRELCRYYMTLGEQAKAEPLLTQVLEMDRRTVGLENSGTIADLNQMALIRLSEGRLQEAAHLFKQVIATSETVKGPRRDLTIYAMNNLAVCLILQGGYAEAESVTREALQRARESLGSENSATEATMANLGESLFGQKKYAESEQIYRQSWEMARRTLGQDHPLTIESGVGLALVYLEEGKFAASESLAREAMEEFRKRSPDYWERFLAESIVGASLAGEKKFAEAEEHLLAGYHGIEACKVKLQVPDRYRAVKVRVWIVKLYRDWGKPDQAEAWAALKSL